MKYKFSRNNWYIGDLWNTGHDMNEVRQWCAEQFGPVAKAPDAWSHWQNNNTSFFRFRDERDWLWFVLRWS